MKLTGLPSTPCPGAGGSCLSRDEGSLVGQFDTAGLRQVQVVLRTSSGASPACARMALAIVMARDLRVGYVRLAA